MKADVLIKELDRVVDNFIKEVNESIRLEEKMKREDVWFDVEGANQFEISIKNRKSNIRATRGLHTTSDNNKMIEESIIVKLIK